MKPIRLTMTAFGPYAGQQVIDFTRLENRKMFVISGKTGAGKTTIFDAISFAMYGKPSGDHRSAADMRSQFADPKLPTQVELEFELKGRAYTIRRTPQQEKKKTRGSGTTVASASAELLERTEKGDRLLAANVRETDEKMTELIGLEAGQFRQILMIPQGDFQKLLVAGSQEKEKILQKLFQTAFYKRVEEVLKEKSDVLKKKAGKAADQQELLLKSLPVFSSGMQKLLEQEPFDVKAVLVQLREDQADGSRRQARKEREAALLREQRDFLLGERERGLEGNKQFDRLEAALQKQKQLAEQAAGMNELGNRISWAEKAEKLQSYERFKQKALDVLRASTVRLTEAASTEKEAEQALQAAEKQQKQEQEQEPQRERARRTLQQLEAMQAAVHEYESAVHTAAAAKEQADKRKKAVSKFADRAIELADRIEQADRQLQHLSGAPEFLLKTEHELEKLQAVLSQLEELREWTGQAGRLEQAERAAREAFTREEQKEKAARRKWEQHKNSWWQNHSAALALRLKEGEPCSVCGSLTHPAPAAGTREAVHESELKAAEAEMEACRQSSRTAEQEWMQAQADAAQARHMVVRLQEKVPTGAESGTAVDRIAVLTEAKSEAEKQLQAKVKLDQELLQLQDEKRKAGSLLEENRVKEKEEAVLYAQAASIQQQLEKTIPEQLRSLDAFSAKLSEQQEKSDQLQKKWQEAEETARSARSSHETAVSVLRERTQNKEEAERSAKEAEAAFFSEYASYAFSSIEQYGEAKKEIGRLPEWKARWEQYEKEKLDIRGFVQELQSAVAGKKRVETARFDDELQELNEKLADCSNEAAALKMKLDESVRLQEKAGQAAEQMAEAEQAYRLAGHLYDVSHGKNEFKVTFERYVLASFLEDILTAANQRLVSMTSGRFLLERMTERAKGNAQSGLDLLVFDQYTGTSRHVKTLSGGESFKAALALALGLAEVVQNYAGGISLETMFVDEGFGTLDPESLDQAIETLMDIQADGRLVGIISHVPELKERIDARLEIKQSEKGSTAAFVFTGENR